MIDKYSTLAFLLFTIFTYGQNIDFEPNINYKAQFLEQNIDEDNNLLVLESKTEDISRVDIFSDDYSESYDINSNKTDIDLNTLPNGNFIIQARVDKKRIIMYLEKSEETALADTNLKKENRASEDVVSIKAKTITNKKKSRYYWVVYEKNSNIGSRKLMKLVHKNELPRIIQKNKLELQTKIGKRNNLEVYAIYNKNKFMNKQFRNPEYFKSAKTSKYFNSEPIYASDNSSESDSNSSNLITAL